MGAAVPPIMGGSSDPTNPRARERERESVSMMGVVHGRPRVRSAGFELEVWRPGFGIGQCSSLYGPDLGLGAVKVRHDLPIRAGPGRRASVWVRNLVAEGLYFDW